MKNKIEKTHGAIIEKLEYAQTSVMLTIIQVRYTQAVLLFYKL